MSGLPDPLLSVRTQQSRSYSSPVGQLLAFDFSSDIGDGQTILGYAVSLSGWCLSYVTNSVSSAENLAVLGINLVPNLAGTTLYVTANAYMSDNKGDAAGSPEGAPSTMVQVTAVALIGTSPQQGSFVGNVYQLESGATSYETYGSPVYGGFLSGFMLTSDDPGSVGSIALNAAASGPGSSFTLSGSATTTDVTTTGTVDAFAFAYPYPYPYPSASGTVANFQIVQASVSWSAPSGSGMTGQFSATFTPPSGMSIIQWGVLTNALTFDYTKSELQLVQFQFVENFPTSPPYGGSNTVSGQVVMNIYNPDGVPDWIESTSSAVFSVIAQFGPS
ncbi:MAG: hypothetical protein JO103_04300 [Candidatus Eremiobacteraeota bacterium]|nr:hypothetical protein [Candidatus Eremiobacteraeota bacterium]